MTMLWHGIGKGISIYLSRLLASYGVNVNLDAPTISCLLTVSHEGFYIAIPFHKSTWSKLTIYLFPHSWLSSVQEFSPWHASADCCSQGSK
jgi:hypothetical protein